MYPPHIPPPPSPPPNPPLRSCVPFPPLQVCRMRRLPVFTFVNKMDRPALDALEIIDQIEKEFNLPCHPINWPIGSGDR